MSRTAEAEVYSEIRELAPYTQGDIGHLPVFSRKRVDWAIVDIEDFARLAAYRWSLLDRDAATFTPTDGRKVAHMLHRCVLGLLPHEGNKVRFRNGDHLDARRRNLEITSVPLIRPPSTTQPTDETLAEFIDRKSKERSAAGELAWKIHVWFLLERRRAP